MSINTAGIFVFFAIPLKIKDKIMVSEIPMITLYDEKISIGRLVSSYSLRKDNKIIVIVK
ncbi:hypothetical protein GCM10022393_26000 [Aquimarina addita]|uniref:Uncharacterized protein n=1 Tax=Aquimarina addita TaxID=870485 RepID=A0ABP6UMI6_9FLAO